MLWSLIIFWIPWRFVFISLMSFLRRWISASTSWSSFNGALSDSVTSRIVNSGGTSLFRKRAANSGFKYIANIWRVVNEFSREYLLDTYETSFPLCKGRASVFKLQYRQISAHVIPLTCWH